MEEKKFSVTVVKIDRVQSRTKREKKGKEFWTLQAKGDDKILTIKQPFPFDGINPEDDIVIIIVSGQDTLVRT